MLDRRGIAWEKYNQVEGLPELFRFARGLVDDAQASEDERIRAVCLLGRSQGQRQPDIQSLAGANGTAIVGAANRGGRRAARIDADEVPRCWPPAGKDMLPRLALGGARRDVKSRSLGGFAADRGRKP